MGAYGMLQRRFQQFFLGFRKDGHCTFGAGHIAAIDKFSDHLSQPCPGFTKHDAGKVVIIPIHEIPL